MEKVEVLPSNMFIACISRTEVRQQLTESLALTNMLVKYGSAMNNQQRLFVNTDTVFVNEQENLLSLNENYQTDDRRYIKQRSEQWHAIRNDARVTGSTAH